MNWLITGANGHLGRKLIEACGGHHRIVALVRSERHVNSYLGFREAVITDYRMSTELTAELSSDVEAWDALIGLTGTIWGKGRVITTLLTNRFRIPHRTRSTGSDWPLGLAQYLWCRC